MKLIAPLVFAFSLSASAESIKCSNADGTLRYDYWRYDGGAQPPDDMETLRVSWIVDDVKYTASEGRFVGKKREVSRHEDRCFVESTYAIKAVVEPQDLHATNDMVICRHEFSKCPQP